MFVVQLTVIYLVTTNLVVTDNIVVYMNFPTIPRAVQVAPKAIVHNKT